MGYNKVMTNLEFDQHLEEFCGKTKYVKGCFGQVLTKSLLDEKRNQYKSTGWFEAEAVIRGKRMGMSNYDYLLQFTQGEEAGKWFAADCVCMQKGILWGYRATPYPGGKAGVYASNGVPDVTDYDWYYKYCTEQKTLKDPKTLKGINMPVGSVMHANGHIGEMHDENTSTVIECAPSVDGLSEAPLSNQTNTSGYCLWDGIGKSVFIDYVEKDKTDGTIKKGDKVTINEGAVYGGNDFGVPVPSGCIGKVYTVGDTGYHNNQDEALMNEITSWVAFKYLTKVSVATTPNPTPTTPTTPAPEVSNIVVGSRVRIKDGSYYGGNAKGVKVPNYCIGVTYTVKKVQTNNGRLEALLKEINSWVAVKDLVLVTEKGASAMVNVGILNIRKGPSSILYRVVGQLKYGDKVTVYETRGQWSRIGVDRWVYSPYLK